MTEHRAESIGLISLTANLALAATKILVGVVGRSYALIADGVESLADCVSSLVVWQGLRISAKEADHEHPYGHGKAEAIASLFTGCALIVSAFLIAFQAFHALAQEAEAPALFTIPALMGIIGIKELLFRYILRQAKHHNSAALNAEAWHHRSDSLTSVAVLIGLCLALFGGPGLAAADSWAALLVTVLIAINGLKIVKPAIDELMDKRVAGRDHTTILNAIRSVHGVLEVETLWIRRSGRQLHVDVHIEVDPSISVHEGHAIAHRVKDKLLALREVAIHTVGTHIEPFGED